MRRTPMSWYLYDKDYNVIEMTRHEVEKRSIFYFVHFNNIIFLKKRAFNQIGFPFELNSQKFHNYPNSSYNYRRDFAIVDTIADQKNGFYQFSYFISAFGEVWKMKYDNRKCNWENRKNIDFNIIFSSNNESAILSPVYNNKFINNIIYFATDQGNIYGYDQDIYKISKIIHINTSIYALESQSNDHKIVIGANNGKVYEYWSFKNWKNDNIRKLLKNWKQDFDQWNKDVTRQITEDVPSFTNVHKRTWIDDKNFQLRTQLDILQDKIAIIKNHDEIINIHFELSILNNKITFIYERISNLRNELLSKINNENEKSEWCKANDKTDTLANIFSLVPVLSEMTSFAKSITTIGCQIIPEYEKLIINSTPGRYRKRREIYEEKNVTKWTDEFTNSINNEQHLPITNNTNFVTNNITSL